MGDLLRNGRAQGGVAIIWCVEDDPSIRDIELYALRSAGFEAKGFEDGASAWEALGRERPDLVLLDVMLPGMDGVELLAKMRGSADLRSVPVIMATAKGQEYDRIKGFELGADDYIVKPFSVMEMVSRVKAVLRRCAPVQAPALIEEGGLTVNLDERTVFAGGARVQLTYKEFEILRLFLSRPGTVHTREQLFAQVWKMDYLGDTRTVDSHIRSLRRKLGPCGDAIETVRNVGYRWEPGRDR